MARPWTEGPRELIQHAVDHLSLGGDFDRRIAMISIDNAVELVIKTYLGLPVRARGSRGPSRSRLEQASQSFPALLDLLERHAADRLEGLGLDDIEWYHRLRNQLYHEGNGITVERARVEAYLQLARALFESLFDETVDLDPTTAQLTKTGSFLALWNDLQNDLKSLLPPKQPGDLAYLRKTKFLGNLSLQLRNQYEELSIFRNNLVHGLSTPDADQLDRMIEILKDIRRHLPNSGA